MDGSAKFCKVMTKPGKDERRSDHLTGVTPPFDRALEDMAGTTGPVVASHHGRVLVGIYRDVNLGAKICT